MWGCGPASSHRYKSDRKSVQAAEAMWFRNSGVVSRPLLGRLFRAFSKHTLCGDVVLHRLTGINPIGSLSKLLRRCGFEIVELSLDPFWVGSSELFQSTRYVGMGSCIVSQV